MFDNILKGLKKDLKNKEFIYKSKYGGVVKGKVKDISLTHQINCDEETNRKILVNLSKISSKVNITDQHLTELKPEFRWQGYSFNIMITSINGVIYNLSEDNIYFI
jgi:hypothetical protein